MKLLLLLSKALPAERMLIDGFIKLLGKDNIHFDAFLPLDEYDFILIFRDFIHINLPYVMYVLKKAEHVIIIDTLDDLLIHKLFLHPKIIAYFKREFYNLSFNDIGSLLDLHYKFYLNYLSMKNMFNHLNFFQTIKAYHSSKLKPLPLSYIENPNFNPSDSKTISVSYIVRLPIYLNIRHKLGEIKIFKERVKIARFLKQFKNSFIYLDLQHRKGLPHETYLRILSQSLCSVSTFGAGYDTYRYWEIPYSGSVLISRKPRTLIPNNFEEGKHVFFFDNLRELKQHVKYLIEDPDTAIKIGREAREFVMKYHSPEARARMIINALIK
jgi:hypothetical protein